MTGWFLAEKPVLHVLVMSHSVVLSYDSLRNKDNLGGSICLSDYTTSKIVKVAHAVHTKASTLSQILCF